MKKPHLKKKMSGRALARTIAVFVFLISITLVGLTVTVFMRTLAGVANTRKIDTGKSAKLAGINGTLLDSLLQFQTDRTSRKPLDASTLNNPFVPLPPQPVIPEAVTPAATPPTTPPTVTPVPPPATPAPAKP